MAAVQAALDVTTYTQTFAPGWICSDWIKWEIRKLLPLKDKAIGRCRTGDVTNLANSKQAWIDHLTAGMHT